jgi:hypothetical protein
METKLDHQYPLVAISKPEICKSLFPHDGVCYPVINVLLEMLLLTRTKPCGRGNIPSPQTECL